MLAALTTMRTLATLALVLASTACIMPPQSGAGGGSPSYASSGGSSGGDPSTSSNDSSMPGTPASASSSSEPAAPSSVSVTIRSSCSQTVKVFFGDKPKFGSGTYSSISSNSVQSHTFRPGDQLWIVDESENGLGSTSVSANTRELEIGSSCTSISSR